jgi:hypothetical protein
MVRLTIINLSILLRDIRLAISLTSSTPKSDTPGSRTSPRVDFALFIDFEATLFLFSLVCLPTLKKTLLLLL